MKTCPFCAEEIRDSAIKCKHCGTMLTGPVAPAVGAPTPTPTPGPQVERADHVSPELRRELDARDHLRRRAAAASAGSRDSEGEAKGAGAELAVVARRVLLVASVIVVVGYVLPWVDQRMIFVQVRQSGFDILSGAFRMYRSIEGSGEAIDKAQTKALGVLILTILPLAVAVSCLLAIYLKRKSGALAGTAFILPGMAWFYIAGKAGAAVSEAGPMSSRVSSIAGDAIGSGLYAVVGGMLLGLAAGVLAYVAMLRAPDSDAPSIAPISQPREVPHQEDRERRGSALGDPQRRSEPAAATEAAPAQLRPAAISDPPEQSTLAVPSEDTSSSESAARAVAPSTVGTASTPARPPGRHLRVVAPVAVGVLVVLAAAAGGVALWLRPADMHRDPSAPAVVLTNGSRCSFYSVGDVAAAGSNRVVVAHCRHSSDRSPEQTQCQRIFVGELAPSSAGHETLSVCHLEQVGTLIALAAPEGHFLWTGSASSGALGTFTSDVGALDLVPGGALELLVVTSAFDGGRHAARGREWIVYQWQGEEFENVFQHNSDCRPGCDELRTAPAELRVLQAGQVTGGRVVHWDPESGRYR